METRRIHPDQELEIRPSAFGALRRSQRHLLFRTRRGVPHDWPPRPLRIRRHRGVLRPVGLILWLLLTALGAAVAFRLAVGEADAFPPRAVARAPAGQCAPGADACTASPAASPPIRNETWR